MDQSMLNAQPTSNNPIQELQLTISPEMASRFAKLTGDFSSLHMDADFARTSAFRTNVVHGMLPILFILCSSVCWRQKKVLSIKKIFGTFLKPVFVEDTLSIILDAFVLEGEMASFEFKIVQRLSQTTVTIGKCELQYNDATASTNPSVNRIDSLLSKPLKEREDIVIEKGASDAFSFDLSTGIKPALVDIIREGLGPNSFVVDDWLKHCDVANLLAVSLCSTFVGMCIPGKKATFVDFRAEFLQSLLWNKKYRFGGEIKFHSASTNMLVEQWQIMAEGEDKEVFVKGEIKTKINDSRRAMPTVSELRSEALDFQLNKKVALITGASRGIGETTAKLLSLFGVNVIINYYRGGEDAKRIVQEIEHEGGKALAIQADVSNRSQVEAMVKVAIEKFGRIDILVNNAVRDARPMPFMETTWEEMQKDIDVTLKGAFNCCQEIVPSMIKNKHGKIINLSTIFAEDPPANQMKYVVSKNALVGLSRSLAVELAPYNIQVNMVVPSMALTDLSSHVPKLFMEKIKNQSPMNRHACPEEIAQAIVFLASSFSSFTTGQKIMVTGGQAPLL